MLTPTQTASFRTRRCSDFTPRQASQRSRAALLKTAGTTMYCIPETAGCNHDSNFSGGNKGTWGDNLVARFTCETEP